MDWTIRPTDEVERLVPLLAAMHALHVAARPDQWRMPKGDAPFLDGLRAKLAAGMTALVAEDAAGAALGYALYGVERHDATALRPGRVRAVLHEIAVASSARRRGIGRALVEAVRGRARAEGATHLATSFWAFNDASAGPMRGAGLVPFLTYADAPL